MQTTNSTPRGVMIVAIVAILLAAAALIVAIVALLARPESSIATPTAPPVVDSTSPRVVSESELREFGASNSPIYWAGPRDGVQYELTRASDGGVFIRYLSETASAGDESTEFLSVVTYPQVDGYTNLLQAAEIDGATSTLGSSGALIVTNPDVPNSAYFSFEGSQFQVEVYSPNAGEALALVSDGTIEVLQ